MDTIYDYMEGVGYVGRQQFTSDGEEFDVNMILPTSSHAMERSDLEDEPQTMYTNLDTPGLQSGSMQWSEVAVDSNTGLGRSCGRSDHSHEHEKRARIIALQNEVVTKSLTTTTTVLTTLASTHTFPVTLACTSSGFTFGIPVCTAAATGK